MTKQSQILIWGLVCLCGTGCAVVAQEHSEHPDDISQQLFETYIARGGMVNASTRTAAEQIVAERGRDSGFWRTILKELQKGEEGSEVGCVHVRGGLTAGLWRGSQDEAGLEIMVGEGESKDLTQEPCGDG